MLLSLGSLAAPTLPARATTYPFITHSWYERYSVSGTTNYNTLYDQGCTAGNNSASGVFILDYGRPAYDSSTNTYGTIDTLSGSWHKFDDIVSALDAFADGYWACSPTGTHIYLALGTSNDLGAGSCSSCGYRVTSLSNAGGKLSDKVQEVQNHINAMGQSSQITASAAIDMEPAWDYCNTVYGTTTCSTGGSTDGSNTMTYLNGFNTNDSGATSNVLWDYGSNEQGYWDRSTQWSAAFGYMDYLFGEVYNSGQANDWAGLCSWAKSKGYYEWVSGTLDTPGFSYTPTQSYDEMMSVLSSYGVGQSHIDYISNISSS